MIVAGLGFRKTAGVAALRDALARAQRNQPAVTALAVPHDKMKQATGLAEAMGLPLIAISPQALAGVATLTQSTASLAARGTGSVAEAAALAAAGPGARLLGPRHISTDRTASCAIAKGVLP